MQTFAIIFLVFVAIIFLGLFIYTKNSQKSSEPKTKNPKPFSWLWVIVSVGVLLVSSLIWWQYDTITNGNFFEYTLSLIQKINPYWIGGVAGIILLILFILKNKSYARFVPLMIAINAIMILLAHIAVVIVFPDFVEKKLATVTGQIMIAEVLFGIIYSISFIKSTKDSLKTKENGTYNFINKCCAGILVLCLIVTLWGIYTGQENKFFTKTENQTTPYTKTEIIPYQQQFFTIGPKQPVGLKGGGYRYFINDGSKKIKKFTITEYDGAGKVINTLVMERYSISFRIDCDSAQIVSDVEAQVDIRYQKITFLKNDTTITTSATNSTPTEQPNESTQIQTKDDVKDDSSWVYETNTDGKKNFAIGNLKTGPIHTFTTENGPYEVKINTLSEKPLTFIIVNEDKQKITSTNITLVIKSKTIVYSNEISVITIKKRSLQ